MAEMDRQADVLPRVTSGQLLVLAETSAAIGATEELEQALRALIGGMARLTGADSGGVRIFTAPDVLTAPHRLFFWVSGDTFVWREMTPPLGPNIRRAVVNGAAVYTPDLLPLMEAGDAVAALAVTADHLRSSLIVPLRAAGRVIGTLHADSRRPNAFDAALLVPLQLLADHTAGALERARLAEAERLGRTWLTEILRTSGAVVFAYDMEGRLTRIERAAASLLGWSIADLLGHHVLEYVAPAARATLAAQVARRLQGEVNGHPYETLLLHRSGCTIPVVITGGPLIRAGIVVGGAGAFTDLTTVRQLQGERDLATAAQVRADAAIRTARAVTHELGSPIGAALGLMELLVDDRRLPDDVTDDLHAALDELVRAADLLRVLGRIERYEEMTSPIGPQLDIRRAAGGGADGGSH